MRRLLAAAVVALTLTACTSDPAPVAARPSASPSTAAPVASTTLWLCRPGLPGNPCEADPLDATVVAATTEVQPFRPDPDPPVDCFYAYPTVSRTTALNAPMQVTPELVGVVRAQAARFGGVCRVFAPVYRQITLSGIFTGHYEDASARATAERDVALAWRDYLANHNDGRGVVLLGHSQGARTLTALLAEEIEPEPQVRERLVSALLLGGDVTDRSFTSVRACRAPAEYGCVVAYSAYGEVPPADAVFGRARDAGATVLCVDPSRLAGRDGALHPYLPTEALAPGLASSVPGVRTGFTAYPGQLRASCRTAGPVSYLHVERAPGARLPVAEQPLGPRWGLHNGDVNLALGDLVEVVRRQAAAYAG